MRAHRFPSNKTGSDVKVSTWRTFAKSLATFAFRDLFNAKGRKGIRKGTQS